MKIIQRKCLENSKVDVTEDHCSSSSSSYRAAVRAPSTVLGSTQTAAAAVGSSIVRQHQWGASSLQHLSSAAAAAASSGAAGAPCPERAPLEDQVSPGHQSSSGTPGWSPRLQHTAALGSPCPAPDGCCTSETVGSLGEFGKSVCEIKTLQLGRKWKEWSVRGGVIVAILSVCACKSADYSEENND